MKLVTGLFNDGFLPVMDGVTNVVKNYAEWLHNTYGSAYVITPDVPDYIDHEPYPVLRYPSIPIPFNKPYRQGLASLDPAFLHNLRQIPFDIIHAHSPFSAGRLALHTARQRNIPIIASFHSKYYDDIYATLRIEAVAKVGLTRVVDFFESVDYVWTVNKGTANTLREYGFHGQIDIIQNGTDFLPPLNKNTLREEVDEKLQLKGIYPVFLYVGQLTWQKNIKTLLEALSFLKSMDVPFQMLMVGSGTAQENIIAMTKNIHLDDRVQFLGSIHDREWLKKIYCRADLFLFPSVYDNASIALREAAAVSCPALLIQGANTSEGVTDQYNGYLSENTPKAIAAKVLQAIHEPETLQRTGQNAYETIYTSWDTVMDDVNRRYVDIVKAGKISSHNRIKLLSPKPISSTWEMKRKKLKP